MILLVPEYQVATRIALSFAAVFEPEIAEIEGLVGPVQILPVIGVVAHGVSYQAVSRRRIRNSKASAAAASTTTPQKKPPRAAPGIGVGFAHLRRRPYARHHSSAEGAGT
jgi:hypothetical protein